MTRARDLADSADKDIAGTLTLDAVNASGVITGLTVEATGDTAAGDNAAMGYTAAEGLILTGQGSTNDVTIKNDADADVIEIPTGTVNVTMAGTLGVTGAVTANAGVVVDNFTLDGTTLALSSGEFVLDVASAINFNSDTGNFRFQDAAVDVGIIQIANSDFIIRSLVSDKDIIFQGNDGGSTITALTLDMSAAGAATFNSFIYLDYIRGKSDNNTGINIAGSDVLSFQTAGSERMRIDSSGNVGIGVSSPAAKVDIRPANEATNTFRIYRGISGGYELDYLNISQYAGDSVFNSYSNNAANSEFIFQQNGTERMRIDSSGNLLVGKTSASDTTAGFQITGGNVVTVGSGSGFTYQVNDGSAFKWRVNANGGVYNFSSNNVNLSDQREKKNIEALGTKWDAVKAWSVKEFHYNADEDSDAKKVGVIAQDIESNHPSLVTDFELTEDTTRKAVKEQQMMWIAIKALQEAQARIETLETKVAALEG